MTKPKKKGAQVISDDEKKKSRVIKLSPHNLKKKTITRKVLCRPNSKRGLTFPTGGLRTERGEGFWRARGVQETTEAWG